MEKRKHSRSASSSSDDGATLAVPEKRAMLGFYLNSNASLTSLRKSDSSVLEIERKQATLEGVFNVKMHHHERTDCHITGVAFMGHGRLLLVDCNNSCLKLLDAKFKMVSRIALSSLPWDVTAISSEEAVVTLPNDKCLLFVRVEPEVVAENRVDIHVGCYGIVHRRGLLYVGYNKYVSILNLEGDVVSCVNIGGPMSEILGDIYSFTVSENGKKIFATDRYNGRVVGFTQDGQHLFTYEDISPLKASVSLEPAGITTDKDGFLYVCDVANNRVRVLTPHGHDAVQDIVLDHQKSPEPWGIICNHDTDQFIVSCAGMNEIVVYTFKATAEVPC